MAPFLRSDSDSKLCSFLVECICKVILILFWMHLPHIEKEIIIIAFILNWDESWWHNSCLTFITVFCSYWCSIDVNFCVLYIADMMWDELRALLLTKLFGQGYLLLFLSIKVRILMLLELCFMIWSQFVYICVHGSRKMFPYFS